MIYLNREQKEQMLVLAMAIAALQELAKHDKLSLAHEDLNNGYASAQRAFDIIMQEILEPEEAIKIKKLANSHFLIVKPKERPGFDEMIVGITAHENLAAFAIHNHCRNCQITDWKNCPLRLTLHENFIPPANEDGKKSCEYKQ